MIKAIKYCMYIGIFVSFVSLSLCCVVVFLCHGELETKQPLIINYYNYVDVGKMKKGHSVRLGGAGQVSF